jgi:hypothetical protein
VLCRHPCLAYLLHKVELLALVQSDRQQANSTLTVALVQGVGAIADDELQRQHVTSPSAREQRGPSNHCPASYEVGDVGGDLGDDVSA